MKASTYDSIKEQPNKYYFGDVSMHDLIEILLLELKDRGYEAENEFIIGLCERIQESRKADLEVKKKEVDMIYDYISALKNFQSKKEP